VDPETRESYRDGNKIARYTCYNAGGTCSFYAPSDGMHVYGAAGMVVSCNPTTFECGQSATSVRSFDVDPDGFWDNFWRFNGDFMEALNKVRRK
jgi:hypothetical protein